MAAPGGRDGRPIDGDHPIVAGPLDDVSAKFYSDGVHLKVGRTLEASPGEGFDLPRVGTGTAKQARTANIPDLRNDENLAVAQTHLAMIRFHNRSSTRCRPRCPRRSASRERASS